MGEIESAYTRPGPHRKRLGNHDSGVCLHVEQTPDCTFFGMIGTCWISRSRPDSPVLLLNQIVIAESFTTAVTPFFPHSLVQAFGKGFCQTVGDGLSHNRVIVIVLGPELIAKFLEADSAGYGKGANMVGKTC